MNCRACRSDRLDEVFSMDPMPLAGGFADTPEDARAMTRYPLTWLLCADCGLVNVSPDIPDDLIYRTYSYAASTVPALVRHHAGLARVLTNWYGSANRVSLLEVGGNDGVLLNQLPPSWRMTNVDPSSVARRASATSGWSLASPDDLAYLGPVDAVTSSNAFAHFSAIGEALDDVARVLRPGGEFWLEVHDLDATLKLGQWDTIYHEHKVEWSEAAIRANFARVGLNIIGVWDMPLHGGLLRVVARKEPVRHALTSEPRDFSTLRQRYAERRPPPLLAHSAAYGAAARGTVYLNQMRDLPIDYVVDASPLRHGKFVPGTGTPVLEPWVFEQDWPDTTLITAWNHAQDIRDRHPQYEGWVVAW